MDTRTQQWSDRCSGPVHRTAGLRVFYPTRSVTVLLFTLVLAPPLAVAQTPRATLDSYGDWTAYILGKSPLRVCYVETTPPSSPAGEQRLSDGRFQVTHRSLNDGFPLVRFTTKPDLSDTVILDSSRRHGLASLFAPVDPQSEGHTRFVEDMQAAEAKNAQAQMVLRSALDMARAAYSLHGFTQAYDAVRARCPPRSPEDATGPLSPSPPRRPLIAVTDLATIAGSPPPSEFSVTGPLLSGRPSREAHDSSHP